MEDTPEAEPEVQLPDGSVIRAQNDRLVRRFRSWTMTREDEILFRHIAGISATSRNALDLGVVFGLISLGVAGYLYFQVPTWRPWAVVALAFAVLAPIAVYLRRSRTYFLYSAGWPGGRWEIPVATDEEGRLLRVIRQRASGEASSAAK